MYVKLYFGSTRTHYISGKTSILWKSLTPRSAFTQSLNPLVHVVLAWVCFGERGNLTFPRCCLSSTASYKRTSILLERLGRTNVRRNDSKRYLMYSIGLKIQQYLNYSRMNKNKDWNKKMIKFWWFASNIFYYYISRWLSKLNNLSMLS